MATRSSSFAFDINSTFERATGQFRGLNANEPGQWPTLPKAAAWLVAALVVIVILWFLVLQGADSELDSERHKEPELKVEYRKKLEGLRHAEEQHYTEKDRTLAALASKAKVTLERSLVASAYFWVR